MLNAASGRCYRDSLSSLDSILPPMRSRNMKATGSGHCSASPHALFPAKILYLKLTAYAGVHTRPCLIARIWGKNIIAQKRCNAQNLRAAVARQISRVTSPSRDKLTCRLSFIGVVLQHLHHVLSSVISHLARSSVRRSAFHCTSELFVGVVFPFSSAISSKWETPCVTSSLDNSRCKVVMPSHNVISSGAQRCVRVF